MYVFSALALLNWLSGRKGIRPVKTEWWGTGMVPAWSEVQTCIWPTWCHCHSLSLASVKSSLVLPFWYRPTRVVPDKGPLNGCVWITSNVKIGTKKCLETTQGRHSIRYLIEHFLRINSDGNSVNVRRWPREWRLRPVSLSVRERGWEPMQHMQRGCGGQIYKVWVITGFLQHINGSSGLNVSHEQH